MRIFRAGLMALIIMGMVAPMAEAQMVSRSGTSRDKAASARDAFGSHEQILQWIDGYRLEPEPKKLPAAVKALSRLGLLRDEDASGVFVGFMAGVLFTNPRQADKLITEMFPMPPEDQGAIVKAIAYSGLPDWKDLLGRFAERMPARKVMMTNFLTGKSKVLHDMPLESGPAPIDTLWGYYFATGSTEPVRRIIGALKWAKSKSDVEKLTVGSMAKWTLANNASRDKELLYLCRDEQRLSSHPQEVREALQEIVNAAETYETNKIRKEALAAIEELKRKGPQPDNPWAKAAYWGSTAIAVGCVVAGATGMVAIGIPCIVTGAASSAAVKLLNSP
jgi:hypothetical protein